MATTGSTSEPQVHHFTYTEGDRLPEIVVTITKEDLTGEDLRMRWERPGDANNLDKAAVAIDLTAGQFKFTFNASDFIPGAGQNVQLRRTTTGGLPFVFAHLILDVGHLVGVP